MQTNQLIRRIGEIEIPAAGRWPVSRGQCLSAERRRGFRTERRTLRTTAGELTIGRRLIGSVLRLSLAANHAGDPVDYQYRGQVAEATRWGVWHLSGSSSLNDDVTATVLRVAYRGVYVGGAVPVAWLTIAAHVCLLGDERRGRRPLISLAGELNLLAPPSIQ